MKVLGIETSCDETAAAVVEDGREVLSNVVVSQIDIFAAYGGVIPEVAARSHLEAMLPVVDKALADARCGWDEIDAIAVTHAPGLLGSLLIGTLTARVLAILHNKPLFAVHHLKSHVYANWLGEGVSSEICASADTESSLGEAPEFPLVALVASGGHTQILYMSGHNQFEIIGTTVDDAVGECFDKVAKVLGLPYPGGPSVAAAAGGQRRGCGQSYSSPAESGALCSSKDSHPRPPRNTLQVSYKAGPVTGPVGDNQRYGLPHPKVGGLDFSFSGLKTAVLRAAQKEVGVPISFPSAGLAERLRPQQVADFAASFQRTAVEILVEKLRMAVREHPEVRSVVLAGGVAANEELRKGVRAAFPDKQVYFPAPALSGDNGAMVAAAGFFEIESGVKATDPYKLNIYPRVSLEDKG